MSAVCLLFHAEVLPISYSYEPSSTAPRFNCRTDTCTRAKFDFYHLDLAQKNVHNFWTDAPNFKIFVGKCSPDTAGKTYCSADKTKERLRGAVKKINRGGVLAHCGGVVIFMSLLYYMFQSILNTFAFGYFFSGEELIIFTENSAKIINLIFEPFP